MIIVLIAIITSALSSYTAWRLDQQVLNCGTPFRSINSMLLLGIAVWVSVLIQLALLLEIPGAYGPIQFWVNDEVAYDFISGSRVCAMFLMIGGAFIAVLTAIATVVSLFIQSTYSRWLRLVVPSVALAIFALAYYWIVHYGFYPSA